MATNSKENFDYSYDRSQYYMSLYKLLNNQRARKVRSDWLKKFKELVRWNSNEKIYRVDGKNSILLFKESAGLTLGNFKHEYLSELLKSSLVSSVAALDRYLHDLLLDLLGI